MKEKLFSGICDKNGVQIFAGDELKLISGQVKLCEKVKKAICVFNPKAAAFGVKIADGTTTRFYAFCQMSNIEYEVIS